MRRRRSGIGRARAAADAPEAAPRPGRSTTSSRQGARPGRVPPLRPPRAPERARSPAARRRLDCRRGARRGHLRGARRLRRGRIRAGRLAGDRVVGPPARHGRSGRRRRRRWRSRRRSASAATPRARRSSWRRRSRTRGDAPVAFELAVEWNVNLLGGGHNPAAYYETAGRRADPARRRGRAGRRAVVLAFGNDYEGVRVEASVEPAARLTWYPVETISNSEGGFERVYQGSSLLFRWPVSLAPGDHATLTVSLAATQTIDRSAQEAG